MKGELTPEQALFMASEKPEFELFDLVNDPWELHNLATDPDYQEIRDKLLTELNNWRKNVIMDKGVTDEFRTGGWSASYPTKTLEEWEGILEKFTPWVFRAAGSDMEQPFYPDINDQ
jgi:hypothetical protein